MQRILFIPQDPADDRTTDSVGFALRQDGFMPITARSAEEAFGLLQREPIGAVVVECAPSAGPDDRGKLLVQLAQRHPHVPRLMLAATADLQTLVVAVNEAQVSYVLSSPCRPEAFVQAVHTTTRKSAMSALTDRLIALARRQAGLLDSIDREATATGQVAPGRALASEPGLTALVESSVGGTDDTDPVEMLTQEEQNDLSKREREILRAVVAGKKPRELANMFFISVHTARNHIKAIYKKLAVHSQGELIAKVLRAPGRDRFRSAG